MINFSYKIRGTLDQEVYISCATSEEEESDLCRLVSETETICNMLGEKGSTGLRIVASFVISNRLCVISSLGNKIVTLDPRELSLIESLIVTKQIDAAESIEIGKT